MRESLILLVCFFFGIIIGYLQIMPSNLIELNLAHWTVLFMLFTVGIGMGTNARAWHIIRELKGRILLIPLGILIGTTIGGIASWLILKDIAFKDALAIVLGLGYYSLSSMLITQYSNPDIGSLALLVNMVRELVTLLFAPILVKIAGGLGPLSVAAASSEACVPIIAKTSGERNAILAIFSGTILTALVPILLTLLYN